MANPCFSGDGIQKYNDNEANDVYDLIIMMIILLMMSILLMI